MVETIRLETAASAAGYAAAGALATAAAVQGGLPPLPSDVFGRRLTGAAQHVGRALELRVRIIDRGGVEVEIHGLDADGRVSFADAIADYRPVIRGAAVWLCIAPTPLRVVSASD